MKYFVTLWHEDRSPCILKTSRIKEINAYTSSLTKIIYGSGKDQREIVVIGSEIAVRKAIADAKERKKEEESG